VPFSVTDFGDGLDGTVGGFGDTAAVLPCLDLVVACDTAAAWLGRWECRHGWRCRPSPRPGRGPADRITYTPL
jgi:hypothetical protein